MKRKAMNALKKLTILLGLSPQFRPQTFTYFIPAPKQSRLGYREKNFDRIVYDLMSKGFEIIDIKTQAITGQGLAGLWVIMVLRPLNNEAAALDLDHYDIENSMRTENDEKTKKVKSFNEDAEIIELEMDPDIDEHQFETTLESNESESKSSRN